MLIVSAADERFAAHFAAMLHSAWTHNPTAQFYFMDCGLEPRTLTDLRGFATGRGIRLNVITIDGAAFDKLPTTEDLSAAAYARLLIPELLPRFKRFSTSIMINLHGPRQADRASLCGYRVPLRTCGRNQ